MSDHTRSAFKIQLFSAVSALAFVLACADGATAQCTPDPPSAGDTVICAAGTYNSGIGYAVDDLTLIVGDATTPSTISRTDVTLDFGSAIEIVSTSGNVYLSVLNSASTIYTTNFHRGVVVDSNGDITNINLEASVSADGATGVYAISRSTTGTLTISTNDVDEIVALGYGGNIEITVNGEMSGGIFARQSGGGALAISVQSVTGGSPSYGVIAGRLTNTASTSDLTINAAGPVLAESRGIYAFQRGTGALTITSQDVTSTRFYDAITAVIDNTSSSADITINTSGDNIGARTGINVSNQGTGRIAVLGTGGTVSGGTGDAIQILAPAANALGLAIDNVTVTGTINIDGGSIYSPFEDGVRLTSIAGSGDIDVDFSGHIQSGYAGIYISAQTSGTTYVDVTRVTSTSGVPLDIRNTNSGDLNVSSTSLVSTSFGAAVYLSSAGHITGQFADIRSGFYPSLAALEIVMPSHQDRDLNLIVTGSISTSSSSHRGLYANVDSLGEINIQTQGVTGGSNASGIHINQNGASFGQLYLRTNNTVFGGVHGIEITDNGRYSLNVQTQSVTGQSRDGLNIRTEAQSLITTNGTITGSRNAIALNNVSALARVRSYGDTVGGVNGIAVGGGGDIYIQAGNETSDSVVGTTGTGIFARSSDNPVFITVAGSVSGHRAGIIAVTGGSGYSRVDIGSGAAVTATSGANAIITRSLGAGQSNDRIIISGTVNGNIRTLSGADTIELRSTGSLASGSVAFLDAGNDELNLFVVPDNAVQFRGGTGTDSLNVVERGLTLTDSNFGGTRFTGFERLNVREDLITLAGNHVGYDLAQISGSGVRLTGLLRATDINISETGQLDLGTGSRIVGRFENSGSLTIGGWDSSGDGLIIGSFTQGSFGVLFIDALGTADVDLLRVVGDGHITLGGILDLNDTFSTAPGRYTILNGTGTQSGTFAQVFGLAGGAGVTQSVEYVAGPNRVEVVTEVSAMSAGDTGSKSSASAANYLLGQLGSTSKYSALGFDVGTMASVAEIGDFAAGITPDVLDSAVLVSDGAALRFGQSLAGCDMNFSLHQSESCAAVAGQSGPAMFGEFRQTSANTGTEVGHSFNAQSFDMSFGVRLTDSDDKTQFGIMSGYSKSGSVSDAFGANPTTALIPAQAGIHGESAWVPSFEGMSGGERGAQAEDGLEAETFSLGGYARRDLGWWSLDGTAMVSTSEAKLVRNITPGLSIAEQAQSEFVSRQFNLQGTATLNGLGQSEFIIKPLATIGNRTLQRDGFTESGADLLGLTVEGQTRNVSYAGIGAEFAPDFTDKTGNGFKGMLRVTGLAYAGDTESEFTARFTNAPGDSSFTYFGQNLDTSILLEGGFQYIAGDGFAIGAEGFGEVNPETGDSRAVGATLQLVRRW